MKSYLLLRDNKESGPFSFEELKKMGLRPLDLIWVQGKSFTWKHPAEIGDLSAIARSADVTDDSVHIVYHQKEKQIRHTRKKIKAARPIHESGSRSQALEITKVRQSGNYMKLQVGTRTPESLIHDIESEQEYQSENSVAARICEYQENIRFYSPEKLDAEPVRITFKWKLIDQRKVLSMLRFW